MSTWKATFDVWRGDDPDMESEELTIEFEIEFPEDVVSMCGSSVPWPADLYEFMR